MNTQKNYLLSTVDIFPAQVLFDDFHIVQDFSLKAQEDNLKEDLLQIAFSEALIIDLGWRPELDCTGQFYVSIIKNNDWNSPLFIKSASDTQLLLNIFKEAVALCKSLI